MTNELMISQNENQNAFIAKLNEATGFSANLPLIPTLKFNAETGQFEESTGEKDAEGKPIYKEIGEEVILHILTTRKMVQTKYNAKVKLYSREFMDSWVELYNEEKKMVVSGMYKELKESNSDLVFVQVLYVMIGDQPYRMKLSGSKLTNLFPYLGSFVFPYLGSFVNDSPARYYTIAKRGKKLVNGKIEYYEVTFERGDEILDNELIVNRVNEMNFYINTMARSRNSEYNQTTSSNEAPMPELEAPTEDIDVDNVPM